MKLKRIQVQGFRGSPSQIDLALDGKSLCLLGENGHGKSTIVDGLELWATGGLKQFTREGCGLDATVNLQHGGPAEIACELTGRARATRALSGRNAGRLEVGDGNGLDIDACAKLPILRHRTMSRFIDQSAGDKKRELLNLLGLEQLLDFRDTLVTAANRIAGQAEAHRDRVRDEERKLNELLDGQTLLVRAESLRTKAQLEAAIGSEQDLLDLELASERVASRVNRSGLVEKLRRALASLEPSAISEWNAVVRDKEATEAEALAALARAGQRALARWKDETCPLCHSAYPRDRLGTELAERAEELEKVSANLRGARSGIDRFAEALGTVIEAIDALLQSPPRTGWPAADDLQRLIGPLRTRKEELEAAGEGAQVIDQGPELGWVEDLLPDLAESALDREENEQLGAFASLIGLRNSVRSLRKLEREAAVADRIAEGVDELRQATERCVQTTVREHIERLSETAADFYGRLVQNPVFDNVKLIWRDERRGGIEFQLRYAGAHEVSPPQRLLSESQLNSLALSFFLARLKVDQSPWQTMVLDDVVNSFDANHRMGLARLLSEEFGEWQVLLFTHDSHFLNAAANFMSGWRRQKIIAWSPAGGPVLEVQDPLDQLKRRLDAGEAGSELGVHARIALERSLKRPIEELGLSMRFDEQSRHGPPEYLAALRSGLKKLGFEPPGIPDLSRIQGEAYLVNVGAHDRPASPNLTSEDLRHLVRDLEQLQAAFICDGCSKPVWTSMEGRHKAFRCKCGSLEIGR